MTEYFSGIISFVFAGLVLTVGCVIIASFIWSRFIFTNYLKRHHRIEWKQMVYTEPHGFNWFSSDLTHQLREFRCKSHEDFGDPRIKKMRTMSIYLFWVGILSLLGLMALFLFFGVISKFVLVYK
jgi:ABC-type transport system involved in multi-copper enzyme maturation permease subunit